MNPNATITIEDPRQLQWSATVLEPNKTYWTCPGSMPSYSRTGATVEIDERPDVLAKRIKGAVAEGYQVLAVNAHDGHELVKSWSLRYMLGGPNVGTYQLKLFGPDDGLAGFNDPMEAFAAIVRTHTDGWHLQPDGTFVWIEPS